MLSSFVYAFFEKEGNVMRIGIIAGHTNIVGKDMGAIGYIKEGTANRQQAVACYKELLNYHCTPLLEPEGLELDDEVAWVNRMNLALAFALHNNAGGGDGWEALVSVTGSGDKLARVAEKHIKALGQNSRGIKKKKNNSGGNWYGFIRETHCPAVIFETAFVDNKEDVKFIDTPAKNRAIGIAYARAIAECYGLKKKILPTAKKAVGEKFPGRLSGKFLGRGYIIHSVYVRDWREFLAWYGYTIDTKSKLWDAKLEALTVKWRVAHGIGAVPLVDGTAYSKARRVRIDR